MFVAGLAASVVRYWDWEVRMRRASIRAAAAIIGAAGVIAACGSQSAAARAADQGTAAPSGTAARCTISARHAASSAATVTLSNADNGAVLCVRVGDHVAVFLSGTLARKWAPIHSDSRALTREANGRLALRVGWTGAFFTAAHPGSARITSTRSACKPAASGDCDISMVFHVTVVVSQRR
jgi:hypothetical protein